MSTKFNPSTNRRAPPPQCKKSLRAPEPTSIKGADPLVAGRPMLITWQIEFTIGLTTWSFSATGYAEAQPTQLWQLCDVKTPIDFYCCAIRFAPGWQTFQILGEGKIGGIDLPPRASRVFDFDQKRPFFLPIQNIGSPASGITPRTLWLFGATGT